MMLMQTSKCFRYRELFMNVEVEPVIDFPPKLSVKL